jgi:hypothetical protein
LLPELHALAASGADRGTYPAPVKGGTLGSRRGFLARLRKLHYSGSYMLVGDRTCKAVLRYARALAESHTSDVVSVPVITQGGSNAYAHLLIGPSSQIFSTPVENSHDEPVDDEVLHDLETATLRLQPSRPVWSEEMLDIPDLDLDSYTYPVAYDYGDNPIDHGATEADKASIHSSGAEDPQMLR